MAAQKIEVEMSFLPGSMGKPWKSLMRKLVPLEAPPVTQLAYTCLQDLAYSALEKDGLPSSSQIPLCSHYSHKGQRQCGALPSD